MLTLHLLLLLLVTGAPPSASDPDLLSCGSNSGTYQANSTYAANLNAATASVTANASRPGGNLFTTAAVGAVPDRAYAVGLCIADVNASECSSCLAGGFDEGLNLCPLNRDASLFYNHCFLRYSNTNFLSPGAGGTPIVLLNTANVDPAVVQQFTILVAALLNATAEYALRDTTGFADSEADGFQGGTTVYGLVQCTPDLPRSTCRDCLAGAIEAVRQSGGSGPRGMRVLVPGSWCFVRYELKTYYNGKPMLKLPAAALLPSPPPPQPSPAASPPLVAASPVGRQDERRTSTIVAIYIIPIASVLVITIMIILFIRMCSRNRRVSLPGDIGIMDSLLLDLSTIQAATNHFAETNFLGKGGFGSVYKGIFPDGQEVAVKRLSQSSSQGIEEMKNELVLVAKLQHRNLVRLLGICLEECERLLVYEYMCNRSLDTILFDREKCIQLDWRKRYQIIYGVARGLQYLHEDSQHKVIHRDLKASNVLLDARMNPKISDFGLARLFENTSTPERTSRVVGTLGYIAPEYAMRGHYSIKSDVYSFGVLVLEIVTGKANTSSFHSEESAEDDLVSLAWRHWSLGTVMEIVDPILRNGSSVIELTRCVHIGLLCIQDNPVARPTMSMVLMMLSSESIALQVPIHPTFYFAKSKDSSLVGLGVNSGTAEQRSMNEVSITEAGPR